MEKRLFSEAWPPVWTSDDWAAPVDLRPPCVLSVDISASEVMQSLVGSSTVCVAMVRSAAGVPELGQLGPVMSVDLSAVTLESTNLFRVCEPIWAVGGRSFGEGIHSRLVPRGSQKYQELKKAFFSPLAKRERVAKALQLLSAAQPIEGVDDAVWRRIDEDIVVEDQ